MPADSDDLTDLVMAWGRGWSVSRLAPAPVEVPGGFRIDLDRPEELGRHVLHTWSAETLAAIAREGDEPRRWIKIVGPAEELAAPLPPKWTVVRVDHLMSASLRGGRVDPPPPYRISVEVDGDLFVAQVRTEDGRKAASARLGRSGGVAVFDRVVTEPDHRRLGLGTAAMAALSERALDEGVRTGVLVASDDGRALYETLGWTKHADVPAAVIPD